MNSREYWGAALAGLIFLLVQLGALALVTPFKAAGYQTVPNPSDPTNSLVYIGVIIVMTAFMLAAFKFNFDQVIRWLIVGTGAMIGWYVFDTFLDYRLAIVCALIVAAAMLFYPEWYVIDTAGVLMGAGSAGLFGISFGLLPAIVLLVVLAVYDAISVYGTKHMLDLASGVMSLRIPVVLVIPLTLSYSLLNDDFGNIGALENDEDGDADGSVGSAADGGHVDGNGADADADESAVDADENDREAFFIGLGDAVIPSVMIASAAFFSPANPLGVPYLTLNLPALCAMIGTFVGLGVLLWMVMKGRAHAGLPLLNSGAIGGYLVGSVLAGVSLVQALGLGPYL